MRLGRAHQPDGRGRLLAVAAVGLRCGRASKLQTASGPAGRDTNGRGPGGRFCRLGRPPAAVLLRQKDRREPGAGPKRWRRSEPVDRVAKESTRIQYVFISIAFDGLASSQKDRKRRSIDFSRPTFAENWYSTEIRLRP